MVEDLVFKDECYRIVGLCMKVHSKLGKGFKEIVYKDALVIEFIRNEIPYQREKPFKIQYEDVVLRHEFTADFFVFNSLILEIKATFPISPGQLQTNVELFKSIPSQTWRSNKLCRGSIEIQKNCLFLLVAISQHS